MDNIKAQKNKANVINTYRYIKYSGYDKKYYALFFYIYKRYLVKLSLTLIKS